MSWRTRWRIYEYVRNSLWIVPAIFVALAVAMGIAIPDVDEHVSASIGIAYGAEAGRSVLGALAGGMITFTGFVFSILLLAVQFGSGQFSPRMLRRFLRDPTTKFSLGIFMATFIYALLVLRAIGLSDDPDFVPSNSISIALLMLLLSMVMFLRLISRTTQGLRVAAVLQELGRDARRVVDRVYPDPYEGGESVPQPAIAGPARTVAHRGEPGVIQSVDRPGLIERASRAGTVIELMPRVGELLAPGAPLFRVAAEGEEIDEGWLHGTVAVGDERTLRQDPAFAFRLLADVSAKALSPGVNDPTTAIQTLDQIELLLRQVAGRRLRPGVGHDEGGTPRFLQPLPSWEDYLSLALAETRQFGEGSVQVIRRLRALLEDLRDAVPDSRRPAVEAELQLLDAGADRCFAEHGDRRAAGAGDRQGLGAARPAA